jgi:hypothetical protein
MLLHFTLLFYKTKQRGHFTHDNIILKYIYVFFHFSFKVSKLSVPGDSDAEPPKPGSLGGRRGSAVNLSRLGSAGALSIAATSSSTSSTTLGWKSAFQNDQNESTMALALGKTAEKE